MRNTVKIKPEFVPYKMRLLGQNQDLLFLILVFLYVITLSMNITYNINITYSPEPTIFGLQWRYQELNLTTFLTKFLNNAINQVWKISAGSRSIYSNKCKSYDCAKLRKSPYIYIAAAMLMGRRMPISPKGRVVWSYRPHQNLGKLVRIWMIMFLMKTYANYQYRSSRFFNTCKDKSLM